jgi:hypothetical protein
MAVPGSPQERTPKEQWDEIWSQFLDSHPRSPLLAPLLEGEISPRQYVTASEADVSALATRLAAVLGPKLASWPQHFQIGWHQIQNFNQVAASLAAMRVIQVGNRTLELFDVAITPDGFNVAKKPYPGPAEGGVGFSPQP